MNEIGILGFEARGNDPGRADAIRVIRSYSHGSGDYTKERKDSLEKDFDKIINGIMERRKKKDRI